eukprot:517720_1
MTVNDAASLSSMQQQNHEIQQKYQVVTSYNVINFTNPTTDPSIPIETPIGTDNSTPPIDNKTPPAVISNTTIIVQHYILLFITCITNNTSCPTTASISIIT